MTDSPSTYAPQPSGALSSHYAEDDLSFTPVPLGRARCDGWHPGTQRKFVYALSIMGSVGAAARAVGMSRASAYRLRDRPAAESFAAAWDRALSDGRARMFDYAIERALNGVTTVTVRRGGTVTVNGGPDTRLINAALREEPPQR